MIKWPIRALFGLLLLTACSSRDETGKKAYFPVNMGASSQFEAHFPVGKALCELLDDPTMPCKVSVPSDAVLNLESVANGQLQLGIAQASSLDLAWTGKSPFKGRLSNLRVLFSLNEEAITLVVREGAGISSFQKLAGKRMNMGAESGSNGAVLAELSAACRNEMREIARAGLEASELAHAMQARTLDGYFEFMSHPNLALARLALKTPLTIVPIEGDCVAGLIRSNTLFEKTTIAGKIYHGVDQDVPTVGVKTWLVTSSELNDGVAYQIVKKVFEDLQKLRSATPLLYHLSPRTMLKDGAVPYHPGALKYFQEKGWFKATTPHP
ncbi:MAG: TAXI family TRAP transporter solute-binding subunit [Magnetococcales bacterium]|nr:TAXI family TRAP transporter solute-binding subunit [Magnetococcales bacterium]